jgi:hypothetical protein
MSDNWKTLRVPKDAYEEAKERKKEQDQTWGEYLTDSNRTGPDADDVATQITAELDVDATDAKAEINDVKELIEETKEEVQSLESSISVTLDATERQKIVEELAREMQR